MGRVTVLVIAMMLGAGMTLAQPSAQERPRPVRGAMAMEALRREPITFEPDIPYAGNDNPRQRLDLYLPKERKSEKLPVIVFIHGGGWRRGDKMAGAAHLVGFVRSGQYAGVSIGYRLSNEAIWPAQIHDCKAALRWVHANAERYGFDPERIAVWGGSAGGQLALMIGMSGDVPELEGDLGPHVGVSSSVACVANYFGVVEFPSLVGQPSIIDRTRPNAPEARLLGGTLAEKREKAREASPTTHITPNDPPVLTIHGNADRIVPYSQAVRLDEALRRAGVPSYFITVRGGGHADFSPAANARLEAFFAKYLLGHDIEVSTEMIEAFAR